MTSYLLDTNIISFVLRGNEFVERQYHQCEGRGDLLVLSAVVDYEIRRGVLLANATAVERRYERLIQPFVRVPVGDLTWRLAAEFWAASRRRGTPIEDTDLLIAAHAVDYEAVLVTDNERHFRLFEPLGLRLENWTQP